MFSSLRDKLKGFFGTKEEPKEEKKAKKAAKKEKPTKSKKSKPVKVSKSKQVEQKPAVSKSKPDKAASEESPLEQELEEVEKTLKKTQATSEDKSHLPDLKQEQSGFLAKLFKKTQAEERQKISIEEEKTKPEEEKIEQEESEEEIIKHEEKPKSFLSRFTSKLTTTTLKKEHVDEIFEPLEIILLENNVNLSTVDKIKENLEKDLVGIEVKKDKIEETILQSLKSSIESVLIEPPSLIELIRQKNKTGNIYTIVFFGINGSGKTTSIAKLAHKLQKSGIKPLLAAADTFRAASIEQLKTHGERLGVQVIAHDYGSDPAAVAFDAKSYAEKHNLNCVLIDTAGRMYTKSNLMKEMEKIIRVSKPDLKIFVAESITGNDATQQASMFNEAIGIDGIILTKADVDEKGGAALSVSQVTGKPIFFLGMGQKYDDLKEFKKSDIMKNLGLD
ncbi:signal recognition particle-docking protein FtsY [Candidatus Pacearchaeota archaeon CG_4_9_14_0_2_um_filter_39_13]|nr:signal recognition particle-docking protein FtsY [Candidatus Pacearchaeota archaeon]PJC44808.1 MAG: signal recognition particle-docking protein FtsY [Candidatus Pacearchaeota archaeon CG_4_9_14_0_2_um_filter_39_13]